MEHYILGLIVIPHQCTLYDDMFSKYIMYWSNEQVVEAEVNLIATSPAAMLGNWCIPFLQLWVSPRPEQDWMNGSLHLSHLKDYTKKAGGKEGSHPTGRLGLAMICQVLTTRRQVLTIMAWGVLDDYERHISSLATKTSETFKRLELSKVAHTFSGLVYITSSRISETGESNMNVSYISRSTATTFLLQDSSRVLEEFIQNLLCEASKPRCCEQLCTVKVTEPQMDSSSSLCTIYAS